MKHNLASLVFLPVAVLMGCVSSTTHQAKLDELMDTQRSLETKQAEVGACGRMPGFDGSLFAGKPAPTAVGFG